MGDTPSWRRTQSDIPPDWAAYRDSLLHPYIIEPKKPGQRSNVTHYHAARHKQRQNRAAARCSDVLVQPIGGVGEGRPFSDLVGHLSSIDCWRSAMEREARETHTFVAEVELPSKSIIPITDEPVTDFELEPARRSLGVGVWRKRGYQRRKLYERAGSSWHRVALPTDNQIPAFP